MFKFSFNSTTLRNLDVMEALKQIKDFGYEGVELSLNDSHLHPLTATQSRINAIKTHCQNLALPIVCLAAGGDRLLGSEPYEPSLISLDRSGREKRLELIRRAMDIANQLEAPVLNINSGKRKAEVEPEQAFLFLTSALEKLLPDAGSLTLVIEPEPDFFIGTSTQGIELVHTINEPRVRLNLDIGHVFCSETNCYEAIEKALPFSRHIHIEDIRNGIHHHEIPGEGDIDFPQVINLLINSGYKHYVSVELHHHADMWKRALGESLLFLGKLMPQSDNP